MFPDHSFTEPILKPSFRRKTAKVEIGAKTLTNCPETGWSYVTLAKFRFQA